MIDFNSPNNMETVEILLEIRKEIEEGRLEDFLENESLPETIEILEESAKHFFNALESLGNGCPELEDFIDFLNKHLFPKLGVQGRILHQVALCCYIEANY